MIVGNLVVLVKEQGDKIDECPCQETSHSGCWEANDVVWMLCG